MKWLWIGLLAVVSASAQPSDRFQALDQVFSDYSVVHLNPSDIDYQVKVLEEPLTIEIDGAQLIFEVEPRNLLSDRYRAEATGEGGLRRQLPLPEVETYKGTLIGAPDIQGRFTITEDGFDGVVFFPDDWLFIEPAANYLDESEPVDMVIYRKSDITHSEPLSCGADSLHHFDEQGAFKAEDAPPVAGLNGTVYTVEVATEADYEYTRRFFGVSAANRKILGILNRIEGIYERELELRMEVVYQHGWETSNDPYRGTDGSDLLKQFREIWQINFQHENYDLAHMWTARNIDLAGIAYIGTVCRGNGTFSYGLSKHYNDIAHLVTAHEIGHNFGATHPDEENPPVASCRRTVMQTSGPIPDLTFCRFSRNQIEDHVSRYNSCFPEAAPPPPPPLPPAVVPNAPSGLTAEAINSNLVRLEWQDNSANEIAFGIERTFESAPLGTLWDVVAIIDRNRSTFVDAELEPSSTYQYQVIAYGAGQIASRYSNIATATTPVAGSADDTPCGPREVLNIPFTLRSVKNPTFFSGDPRFRVEVPAEATGLLVNLRALNPDDDIDLHVNHGSYTRLVDGFPDADHSAQGETGNESIYINSASNPPLQPGTYYLSVSLFTTGRQVKAVISAKLEY